MELTKFAASVSRQFNHGGKVKPSNVADPVSLYSFGFTCIA